MGESEEHLVWLARAGDREAFSELVSLFESKVYRAAYALAGNDQDAMDLSQETFIRAFKGIGRFRGRSSFFTWLYRILLNSYRSWMRKRRRIPETVSRDPFAEAETDAAVSTVSDFNQASSRETVEKVYRAISSLPTEQKMAIVLHCLEEMSYRDIACAMNCSMGTVKSRIHTARIAIKEMLFCESGLGERKG